MILPIDTYSRVYGAAPQFHKPSRTDHHLYMQGQWDGGVLQRVEALGRPMSPDRVLPTPVHQLVFIPLDGAVPRRNQVFISPELRLNPSYIPVLHETFDDLGIEWTYAAHPSGGRAKIADRELEIVDLNTKLSFSVPSWSVVLAGLRLVARPAAARYVAKLN